MYLLLENHNLEIVLLLGSNVLFKAILGCYLSCYEFGFLILRFQILQIRSLRVLNSFQDAEWSWKWTLRDSALYADDANFPGAHVCVHVYICIFKTVVHCATRTTLNNFGWQLQTCDFFIIYIGNLFHLIEDFVKVLMDLELHVSLLLHWWALRSPVCNDSICREEDSVPCGSCFRIPNLKMTNVFTEVCSSYAMFFFLLRICIWQAVLQIYHIFLKSSKEQN